MFCNGFAELGEHDRAGDPVVGGHRESEPGVVIEPGQDLAVGTWTAVRAGEPVVGEVGLPRLVGLVGLEADVGRLRFLLRLRNHQSSGCESAGDRRPGHRDAVVVFQVPTDGLGAGIEAGRGQLLAELDDQLHDLGGSGVRVGPGPPGGDFEDALALDPVTGEQGVEPGAGDAVVHGDVTDRSVLDHHSGDQQSVQCHARTLEAGAGSVRDVVRHQSAMS